MLNPNPTRGWSSTFQVADSDLDHPEQVVDKLQNRKCCILLSVIVGFIFCTEIIVMVLVITSGHGTINNLDTNVNRLYNISIFNDLVYDSKGTVTDIIENPGVWSGYPVLSDSFFYNPTYGLYSTK